MNFNVNDYVYVKLTAHGYEILRKNWEYFGTDILFQEPKESVEYPGYVQFQMWELMREFGPHLGVGTPLLPFEMNIKLQR